MRDPYKAWKENRELCGLLGNLLADPIFRRAKETVLASSMPSGRMEWASAMAGPEDVIKFQGLKQTWLTGVNAAFLALEDLVHMAEDREVEDAMPPLPRLETELEYKFEE
jgi:hypothetical protein